MTHTFRVTSIKTRIETYYKHENKLSFDLLESLPLKQGLKPAHTRSGRPVRALLESLPLKQGLKRGG